MTLLVKGGAQITGISVILMQQNRLVQHKEWSSEHGIEFVLLCIMKELYRTSPLHISQRC